jgi:hypothetical protein
VQHDLFLWHGDLPSAEIAFKIRLLLRCFAFVGAPVERMDRSLAVQAPTARIETAQDRDRGPTS